MLQFRLMFGARCATCMWSTVVAMLQLHDRSMAGGKRVINHVYPEYV
jgi:hypothetical protein